MTHENTSLTENDKERWFEDEFLADLDSWFSADIACCDNCYDDFVKLWPHAYNADDAKFQRSSIDLDTFYSGSRLQAMFTKEEFDKYVSKIECPRCYHELTGNIWPYCFPFDVTGDFEIKIEKIAEIVNQTPFLLLENDFAKEVFNEIGEISKNTKPVVISDSLYRGRIERTLANRLPEQFDFPADKYVSEGRYNHSGIPVLYLANNPETCKSELRFDPCVIAKIKISFPVKILNLTNTYEDHSEQRDLLDTLVYSALLSAPHEDNGQHKPEYVFSRFLSDCAKFSGFDAIQYPSTRMDGNSFNLVLLNNKLALGKGIDLEEIL